MIPDVELFLFLTAIVVGLALLWMLIGATVGSIRKWWKGRK